MLRKEYSLSQGHPNHKGSKDKADNQCQVLDLLVLTILYMLYEPSAL